jgi:dTMP kinase
MCSTEKVGAVSSSGMAAAIRVYPESGCLYPELQSPPIFSRLLSHRELSHAAPFSANSAKLNRQTPEIEHLATRTKQPPVICSNRQKIYFWFDENQRLIGLRQGTASAVPKSVQNSGVSTPEVRDTNSPAIYKTRSSHSQPTGLPLTTSHSSSATDPYVRLGGNSMPARGKFIVLEGIDGSGKRTQLEMLVRAFASRGVACSQISFPRYDGFFGKMAGQYLNGDFGSLEAVDPHFSALLYAGDRFEAKPRIESDLASGQTVVADRYIGSNLAHQSARVPPEKRAEFLQWLKQLEYQVYALPAEDLVIYLRVPPAEAHRLVGEKAARDYTKLRHDIHESDLAHLQATSEVYDQLARQPNWVKIECYDSAAAALRAPESIHQEILAAVQARVTPTLRANK